MNEEQKTPYGRIKQFVVEHPTLTYCAIAAVTGAALTRMYAPAPIEEIRHIDIEVGGDMGALAFDAINFINNRGLMEEFLNEAEHYLPRAELAA